MTETAFRVVVPPQDQTGILAYGPELRRAIQFHGFEGVTVTPMDDALIKAAEAVRNACLGKPVGGGDGGTFVVGRPTADQLNAPPPPFAWQGRHEMIEPKACPFCRGPAEVDYMQPFRAYQTGNLLDQPAIYCTVCCAQISHYMKDVGLDRDDTMALVLEAWNTRAPDPAIDALQAESERLRAALKAAIEALRDDTGLDDGICCSGYHCGCRGSTNREVLLYELRQALEASHER